MAELPSEIMYDILSRMPVKSLAGFRCVSNLWGNYINDSYFETMHAKQATVDDPMLIVLQQFPYHVAPDSPCILSFLEYKEEASTCTVQVRMRPKVMEFMCKSSITRYPINIVLGSCNGLLYLTKGHRDVSTRLVVIHPLRKECYELPPIKRPLIHPHYSWEEESSWLEESFGLGFDESTNTFKMVSVQRRHQVRQPKINLCTRVHVLGTNSWRKIQQVPSYPLSGEGEGVFTNGCLHWLMSDVDEDEYPTYLGRSVISFDVANEEFGLIKPPHGTHSGCCVKEQLVDLHGEVGYVYYIVNHSIEVWVLKESGWVMHCEFQHKPPLLNGFIKVLGFWNANGDVLMTDITKHMFVYELNSNSLHEVSLVGGDEKAATDIIMYQSSLFSTRYSIKN